MNKDEATNLGTRKSGEDLENRGFDPGEAPETPRKGFSDGLKGSLNDISQVESVNLNNLPTDQSAQKPGFKQNDDSSDSESSGGGDFHRPDKPPAPPNVEIQINKSAFPFRHLLRLLLNPKTQHRWIFRGQALKQA